MSPARGSVKEKGMDRVSALTLRKKLGSILDEVAEKKKAVTVTRSDKPLVAIIPYEEYERREERVERLSRAAAEMDRLGKRLGPKLRDVDATAAIRKMRDQR